MIRTKTVFQMEASECGAACLSMILKYHGCHVSMEELRIACGVSRNGTNAATLVVAAKRYGLDAKGYKVTAGELGRLPVPCILHWKGNHFVLFEGIRGKKAFINDPAAGRRKLSLAELEADFSGVAICYEENGEFRKNGTDHASAGLMGERIKSERRGFVFLILTALTLTIPGLLIAVFTQIFMDNMFSMGDGGWLKMIIVGIALVSVSQTVLTYIQSDVLARMNRKLTVETGRGLMEKMLRLPLAFYEQRYAGELTQREDNNSRVNSFLSGSFSKAVLGMIHVFFYLLLMFRYSPKLTVIGLIGVAVNILILEVFMRPLADYSIKKQQDKNQNMGYLCAGLSVYSSIKAGGTENEYVSELMNKFADVTRSEQRSESAQQIMNALPGTVSRIFNVLVMLVGSVMVIKGTMSGGKLFAFCQLLSSFMSPLIVFLSLQQKYQSTKADLACVEDVQCANPDPWFDNENSGEEENKALSGWVHAKNITYGYDPNIDPVLADFSVKIAPGRSVGIVGDSGSGKSTAAKIMASLITPWDGEVLYDNRPRDGISKDDFTDAVSVVSQHESFFSGTIYDNLSLWNPDADRERVVQAVNDSGAAEFIKNLPGGLQYRLTEGGSNLSGGQRQQLSIARALLNNPKILILDEATSAMDPIIEEKTIKQIEKYGCTVIMVAHRLSTVRNCDLILVMRKGRIKEAGNHEKLMAAKGLYYSMQK